jgi:hemerythrin-like domain-containing protein
MAQKKANNDMDRQIDENLRRVYQDAAKDPVPDRFAQLLEQLRQQDEGQSGKDAS